MLAHGFTQTGRLWGAFGQSLARGRTVVGVDLPGHAGSDGVRVGLVEGGALLAATARGVTGGPADLLGYSLGARLALHAALDEPAAVRRLVLIGGTGGLEDPDARSRRRAADEATADALEATDDVAGFVDDWLSRPMFAGLREGDGRAERLRNSAPGLASSLRLAGLGTQEPLWDRLRGLAMPVLVIAGADDPRFVAHGLRLARSAPHAVLAVVPGAGHAAHLHAPALTARLVARWLDTVP